jgi:hypothetical protein
LSTSSGLRSVCFHTALGLYISATPAGVTVLHRTSAPACPIVLPISLTHAKICRWKYDEDAELPACPELVSLDLWRSPFGPRILRGLRAKKLAHLSIAAYDYGDDPSLLIDSLVQTGSASSLRSLTVKAQGRINEAQKAVFAEFCTREKIELVLC